MSLAPFGVLSSVENLRSEYRGGKRAFAVNSYLKEIKPKKSLKIVSLRVPEPPDCEKLKYIPGVVRVCQEKQKKTLPKKLDELASVTVPPIRKKGVSLENYMTEDTVETSRPEGIPTIERCSQEEIRAIKRNRCLLVGKNGRRHRKSAIMAEQWGATQRNDKPGEARLRRTCTLTAMQTQIA